MSTTSTSMHEAWEVVGDPEGAGPFIFTCEHASNRLVGVTADASDRALLDDHWGWDIGAADVVRALCEATGSVGVLSRFSRLVIDPNRDLDEPSLILPACHGQPVSFNTAVDEVERARRIDGLWRPFHEAVDRTVKARLARGPAHLVSVHSFTPVWLGHPRPMELGVLFDEHHEVAFLAEGALREQGFEVSLNEPYSGKSGLIYSVARHGRAHDVPFLELEVRNDLIATPESARAVAARIREALRFFEPGVTLP